jgi:hypothetical protein
MEDLPDLSFLAEDKSINEAFAAIDLHQVAKDDPWLAWRMKLNLALAEEGINILWGDGDLNYPDYAVVQPIMPTEGIRDYEKIPILHLRELFEHEDNPCDPRGVASYIRSVLFDKRFRLWQYEE